MNRTTVATTRQRLALSLKPDHVQGDWEWCLASAAEVRRGRVPARDREDAALCAIAEVHEAVRADTIEVVVTLSETARLWDLAADIATAWPGVRIVQPAADDTEIHALARLGLERHLEVVPEPRALSDLRPLTVATDGSAHRGRIAWGWLAEDGTHACGTSVPAREQATRRSQIVLAELIAISEAIRSTPARPLLIRSDSRVAIALVRAWAAGGDRLPGGYNAAHHTATRRGGLCWMQEQVRREAHRLDIVWVHGHAGDPLNEGADSLAKLARRAAEGTWGYGPADVPDRASAIATAFAVNREHTTAA